MTLSLPLALLFASVALAQTKLGIVAMIGLKSKSNRHFFQTIIELKLFRIVNRHRLEPQFLGPVRLPYSSTAPGDLRLLSCDARHFGQHLLVFHQFTAGRLQPFDNDFGKASHQLITQVVILFTQLA
jgi:hypothetical protein